MFDLIRLEMDSSGESTRALQCSHEDFKIVEITNNTLKKNLSNLINLEAL